MNDIYNERIKLVSTGLSNLGIATIAAGILAPAIGYFYGSSVLDTGGWWLMLAVAWLLVGAGLHLLGMLTLGWLRP